LLAALTGLLAALTGLLVLLTGLLTTALLLTGFLLPALLVLVRILLILVHVFSSPDEPTQRDNARPQGSFRAAKDGKEVRFHSVITAPARQACS
jgi:UPF0716 family protein affecting phage T7 exclusion